MMLKNFYKMHRREQFWPGVRLSCHRSKTWKGWQTGQVYSLKITAGIIDIKALEDSLLYKERKKNEIR